MEWAAEIFEYVIGEDAAQYISQGAFDDCVKRGRAVCRDGGRDGVKVIYHTAHTCAVASECERDLAVFN